MKRAIFLCFVAASFFGCTHRWVGKPVLQLERELGRPRSIQPDGPNRIYYYPDTLAGRGQMTFTVDSKGIIRDWNASTDVPGVFGGDVFGVGATDALGDPIPTPVNGTNNPTNNPNGGLGR
jgi:hypothetical protein